MWIMIAGPYSSGGAGPDERAARLRLMNEAAYAVFRKGHVPVIGVNMVLPVLDAVGVEHYDEVMMPVSLALAERCDACLRIGGESAGADEERDRIAARGGAVFASLDEVPDGV